MNNFVMYERVKFILTLLLAIILLFGMGFLSGAQWGSPCGASQ